MKKILIAAILLATFESAQAAKPNILFIISDDQSWETVGAMGGEVETPNLDKLVARGVSFRHAYNMGSWAGAVCVASRSMFITGRQVWNCKEVVDASTRWKKTNKAEPFPNLGKTWPGLLGEAGYTTYFSGKWHIGVVKPEKVFEVVGTERPGMPGIFPGKFPQAYNRPVEGQPDEWKPYENNGSGYWEGGTHWSEVLRDEAIGFIEKAAKEDEPFFMYLAFNAPHDPRQAPRKFIDLYPLENIKLPENFQPLYPYADEIGCGETLRDERLAPFPRTEHAVKVHRQEYYALITHMDEQIGQILDALEKSGKLDNTYIFYTSDHGLAVGHHGLLGKQNMYEHSLGAPLIVNGPGLEPGKRVTERVYIQDIVPSTLELAGVEAPPEMDFQSLIPLANGDAGNEREVIYGAYRHLQRCIIKKDWKLIHYPEASKYRLFNLEKDPDEMNDLAENPEAAEQLKLMKLVMGSEMKNQSDPLLK